MDDLITNYSVEQIILFIVSLAVALKAVISFWDWAVERLRKVFNKETKQEKKDEELEKLKEQQLKMHADMDNMMKSIQLLLDSDKDDIKAWIIDKHHHFCYEKRYIDDYSLDCLERRYDHYIDEGGNHFIHQLMDEIRRLPRVSNVDEHESDKKD